MDVAQEMVNFTKLQILSQSGTSMLAQANQSAQGVLSLLRGSSRAAADPAKIPAGRHGPAPSAPGRGRFPAGSPDRVTLH